MPNAKAKNTGKKATRSGRSSDLAALIDRLPCIVFRCYRDANWSVDYISAGCRDLTGYEVEAFLRHHRSLVALIHPDDLPGVKEEVQAAGESNETFRVGFRIVAAGDAHKRVWMQGRVVRDDGNIAFVGILIDVSLRKSAEKFMGSINEKLRVQAALLDQAREAIVVRGIDQRIEFWNKGAERLYGWTEAEVCGRLASELYANPDDFDRANAMLLDNGAWSGELTQRRKDGSRVVVEAYWTLVRDHDDQPQCVFCIASDITERKEAQERVHRLAYYDSLTGLPNRPLLLDRLRHYLGTSARTGRAGALMFIDLDRFKILNDTMGHDVGDMMLQQVAERISSCVRQMDTVARFGGDEFVVLLESLDPDTERAALQAEHVAEKILAAFLPPFQLGEVQHRTSPSIGITLFKGGQDSESEILKRADMAMYQAKATGRNAFRFFDPQMQETILRRVEYEADLRRGWLMNEFLLYYQPQVSRSGIVQGAEAFIRWMQRGELREAAAFVAVAEDSDVILPIGKWVLEAACSQLAAWSRQPETAHLTLSLNISARHFRQPGFVSQVLEIIERSGANPSKLKLELTERILHKEDMEDAAAKMRLLRNVGICFSLDDFGTGSSSLSYLRSLSFDELKIDRSFVRGVFEKPNDGKIAASIVALGRSLDIRVVAEGVETREQHEFLERQGCYAFQGYLFGRPVPATQFIQLAGLQ